MMILLRVALVLALAGLPGAVHAAPRASVWLTSPPFADHMVLQQGRPIPIWGRGTPGGDLSVHLNGQVKHAVVGPDGAWRVDLEPMAAGGPFRLEVVGSNTVTFEDVLVGEVWIASGQSNMAQGLVGPPKRTAYPLVRTLREHSWEADPSETAWFLGKYLSDARQVPIGIINEAVSGSQIRWWLPDDAQQDLPPEIADEIAPYMGLLFDRNIAPLVPYAIRGVFWWQGESDRTEFRAMIYREQLTALIHSWRRAFEQPLLPFIFIELPTGGGLPADFSAKINASRRPAPLPRDPPDDRHPSLLLYDAYQDTLADVPFTGMVVTKDLGNGIHPTNRAPYAERMVRWARHMVYGEPITYAGPIFESVSREGDRLRVRFRSGTATGLHPVGPYPPQGFAISEDGERWVWADADIQGTEVVLGHPELSVPAFVRYAWDSRTLWANLANDADIVAAPFEAQVPSP
jgi:sialate O-acetylesterase